MSSTMASLPRNPSVCSSRLASLKGAISLLAIALVALSCANAQAIDQHLTPSLPTVHPISCVDTTLNNSDRLTLMVDNNPFFFNAIQLRADKLRDVWSISQHDIASMYQQVADDGFTAVSTQLLWSEIQPDSSFNASSSAYIQGGKSADTNFASSASLKFGYGQDSQDDQQLVYLKFDFSNYHYSVDSAKVRVYVDSAPSTSFTANLFGITNNDWNADNMTWNDGAPNHDGARITGTNGKDYFLVSSSPSWDPIKEKQYYDFDCTKFLQDKAQGKVASFILQASMDNGTVGASIHGASGAHTPRLVISDKNRFEWSYIDTMIAWAADAGLKLELVWFGSDSTGVTMDSRVPYYVLVQYTKTEKLIGGDSHQPVFSKNVDPAYGIYWYLMDKNDLALRQQEKHVIKTLMNHIADYNRVNGNQRTVIGVDVANEPAIFKFHGSSFTPWQNPNTWGARARFNSLQDFKDRTMWEFCINLANAVKESQYPVWTRSNDVRGVDAAHASYNEAQRVNGGTSLDFVGLDPYSRDFILNFKFGHTTAFDGRNYATGFNLPMIMENGGSYPDSAGLLLASLAGGALYSVYDFMSSDALGLYVPRNAGAGDYTPVKRGSYVDDIRNTNIMLKKISHDLATKRTVGAGGSSLDFLNVFWNLTETQCKFGNLTLTFVSQNAHSVTVVDKRGRTEVALLSTRDANFTITGIGAYGLDSVQSGSYNGTTWVTDRTIDCGQDVDDISCSIGAHQCIRVVTKKEV